MSTTEKEKITICFDGIMRMIEPFSLNEQNLLITQVLQKTIETRAAIGTDLACRAKELLSANCELTNMINGRKP
jgi:hypothetical protein